MMNLYIPSYIGVEYIITLVMLSLLTVVTLLGITSLLIRELKIVLKIRTKINIKITVSTLYWYLDIEKYPNYIPGLTDWHIVIDEGVTIARIAATNKPAMDFSQLTKGDSVAIYNHGVVSMDPFMLSKHSSVSIQHIQNTVAKTKSL